MPIETLASIYNASKEFINVGDYAMVDDRAGYIREVCMPGTVIAEHYCCEESGGLLIEFENGLLELLPFGHHHRIVKLERAKGSG